MVEDQARWTEADHPLPPLPRPDGRPLRARPPDRHPPGARTVPLCRHPRSRQVGDPRVGEGSRWRARSLHQEVDERSGTIARRSSARRRAASSSTCSPWGASRRGRHRRVARAAGHRGLQIIVDWGRARQDGQTPSNLHAGVTRVNNRGSRGRAPHATSAGLIVSPSPHRPLRRPRKWDRAPCVVLDRECSD